MAIEFEPERVISKCRRFLIETGRSGYWAIDRNGSHEDYQPGHRFDTFSAAAAWCEERAKRQQGQGGQLNV